MHKYFPYSHIVSNVCSSIKKTINKHMFVGDWQVYENKKTQIVNRPQAQAFISEIYY